MAEVAKALAAATAPNSALYFFAKASLLSRIASCALRRNLVSSSVAWLSARVKPMRSTSNLSLSLSTSDLALSFAIASASSLFFSFNNLFARSISLVELDPKS